MKLLTEFQQNDEIVILKARQLGISWLVAAYGLWKALFNESAKVLFISQGESEAWDMVAKARFIWEHLPEYFKMPLKNDTRGWLSWHGSNSEIRALPSTEKAGRGTDATLVVRDELANHPYGEENFTSISPTIDSGGQLIDLSTINKLDQNNHFTQRVVDARDKKSNARLIFLGWKLRPVRLEGMTTEEWFESRIKPKYTPLEIEQEYPETIEDALKPSLVKSYFEIEKLNDMDMDVTHPIKQKDVDTRNGIVRVYKPPDRTRQYVIYTDPSDGVEDPFVTGVMDFVTGEVVCTASGMMKVDLVAGIHDYLVREYNNATNCYEYNAVGMAFAMCLDNLSTPNQAPRRRPDGSIDPDKKGYFMSGQFKDQIFGDLALAVANRKFVIHDREFMQQAKMVTRDDYGKPVTEKKLSFDWVMMMAGLWQLQKYIPISKWEITSGRYRA